jgi:ABC-type glycerol-3-phosphate transport system permease component
MADIFNLVMLICATLGSMAFGVLTAYGIFRMVFGLMRPRRQILPVKARPEEATAL